MVYLEVKLVSSFDICLLIAASVPISRSEEIRVTRPTSRPRYLHLFFALVLLALPSGSATAQVLRPEAALAADAMSLAAGARVAVSPTPTGLARFVRTVPGAPIPLHRVGSAEERALAFVEHYGAAFGIDGGVEARPFGRSSVDDVGMEHVRLRQVYQGVPLAGGGLTVHLHGQAVVAVHAKTVAGLDRLDPVPVVTAAEARGLAAAALAEDLGVTGAVLGEPRLEFLNKGLLGDGGFETHLTWFVEARKIDLREFVWVDARSGRVVLRFSQLTDARDRQTYDANDPGDGLFDDLPGSLVRTEVGPPVVGAAATDANAAHDHAGATYDYFSDEHGRDSFDGAGATLASTVRFCPGASNCPYANAFWNGVQMVYGTGFPAADDVVAHELTHAVTERTAGLFYYMQSGALNESYSDIFGETVDLLNGSGTDTAGARWLLGEDVPAGGAVRDMENPPAFGDPGKTSDPQFVCGDPGGDQGGVHSNSGVPNRAYALMVDGGSYNGQTVAGIGLSKAGKIQFRALTLYLLSASDFADNDLALRQSCQDLIGTAGITAADCTEVGEALDAVEMAATWPCAPSQAAAPAFCPAGRSPTLWYHQDFEGDIGLTTCPSGGVIAGFCVNRSSSLLGSFATSGTSSAWGYNQGTTDLIGLQITFPSLPPAGSRLRFNHSYGFENATDNYDGGQVHYSTNGGSTWLEAGGSITGGQSYGGVISSCCGNPLSGQSAFVRDSWGYGVSQLSLGSLSGSAFAFRWVIGTDDLLDDYGWFIDDVRIYSCATCVTDRILDTGYTGTAEHYQAADSITAGDGFTVLPGESVTLEAGNRVVLGDGFRVIGELAVVTDSGACPP